MKKKDSFYQRNILLITWNDLGNTVNIMLNSGVFSSNNATMTAADSWGKTHKKKIYHNKK